jgi:hypothetical protein
VCCSTLSCLRDGASLPGRKVSPPYPPGKIPLNSPLPALAIHPPLESTLAKSIGGGLGPASPAASHQPPIRSAVRRCTTPCTTVHSRYLPLLLCVTRRTTKTPGGEGLLHRSPCCSSRPALPTRIPEGLASTKKGAPWCALLSSFFLVLFYFCGTVGAGCVPGAWLVPLSVASSDALYFGALT